MFYKIYMEVKDIKNHCVPIDSRGYGKIYKAVTRNPAVPLIAKAIYAYLCSYAGNGTTAFPSRNKITRDLKINKDTCTKYINTLVKQGYLKKQRTTTNNLYTVVQSIEIEIKNYDEVEVGDDTDLLVFRSIGYKGFGTVPKLLMLDNRLTSQAKAIYSYFASFAGAGNTAFPRRTTTLRELNISEPTYYKHYNLLVEHGYVTSEQKTINGRFNVSVYELQIEICMPEGNVTNKAMSQNLVYGRKPSIIPLESSTSEKFGHDNHNVENSKKRDISTSEKVMSEKLTSGELVSEKSAHSNLGHTNNNNIPYKKQDHNKHNYKEQIYNQIKGESCGKPPIPQIKKWINYEQHVEDMEASMALRNLLGQSDGGVIDAEYMSKYRQIITILPQCIDKQIETAITSETRNISLLREIFCYEEMRDLIDRIMDNYEDILSPVAYLQMALTNHLKQYNVP